MVRNAIDELYDRFPLAHFVIVDQASTAVRTRLALKQLAHKDRVMVRYLPFNVGPRLVKRFLHQQGRFSGQAYVLTDPDLDFSSLPDDALDVLSSLCRDMRITASGLALDISDPDDILDGDYVGNLGIVEWELRFWQRSIQDPLRKIYLADVDTTFCLYDWAQKHKVSIRLAGEYCVRHLPWHKSYVKQLHERDYWDYFLPASRVSTSSRLVRHYWQAKRMESRN